MPLQWPFEVGCTYLEGVQNYKDPSKNTGLFIDCKQSNDPGEAKKREEDDESFEEFPV